MDATGIGIAIAGGSIGARGAMTGESIAASVATNGAPIGRHDLIGRSGASARPGRSVRNGRNVLPDPIGRNESSARRNRIEGDDP
ncbi:MAG TPA: hypothetical protein VFO58_22080 [Vicinamibacterales bacterium]|nr:hypothetical protein [Vicinamibacterales bacterium]